MTRAVSVLPVPVGPVMSTGASVAQAWAISTKLRCIDGRGADEQRRRQRARIGAARARR